MARCGVAHCSVLCASQRGRAGPGVTNRSKLMIFSAFITISPTNLGFRATEFDMPSSSHPLSSANNVLVTSSLLRFSTGSVFGRLPLDRRTSKLTPFKSPPAPRKRR